MISAKLLNTGARVDDYKEVGSVEFISGIPFNIVLQLVDP